MAERQINSVRTEGEISDSIDGAYDLGRKQASHKGMEGVQISLELQRSSNEVIIFSYGLSGAGKSATLNHLFGFEVIDSKKRCGTQLVTEYVTTVESQDLGVANLKIGFIDVPGWCNERGEEKDISNIATIDWFIKNHLFIGRKHYMCFPNIVMIAINATDRRISGANSQLVRMFRALTKLSVIDKSKPNILIVLTHIMDLGRKSFPDRLNEMSTLVKELAIWFLGVEPFIAYIENDFVEYGLEVMGDWSILSDGTLQPKNVFQAMVQLTQERGDNVGLEAIRLFFASRGANKPVIEQQLMPGTLSEYEIMKWRSIMAQEFAIAPRNEVSQVLQTYAEVHPDVYSYRSLVPLMNELNTHLLTHLDTIQSMTLNQVQDVLAPYILSPIEMQALVEGCRITGYEVQQVIREIGYGVNAETGVVSRTPVLNQSSHCHVQRGVNLPVSMNISIPTQNRRIEWDTVPSPDCCYSETTGGSLVKYQFKIIHSIYTIKMASSDNQQLLSQLSPTFMEAVRALPESSIGQEDQLRAEYVDFLNTFGHCVIIGYECGGFVQGVVEMEQREYEQSQMHNNLYIQSFLDKLESDYLTNNTFQSDMDEIKQICKQIGTTFLSWDGGHCPGQFITLDSLTPWMWVRWINSLQKYPIPVENPSLNKGQILPIYELVSLIDSSKRIEIEKLIEMLAIELNQIPLPRPVNYSGSLYCSVIPITPFSRGEAAALATTRAQIGFPENSLCIRGSWDNFSEVRIQDILENDKILVCRDPCWVHFDKAGEVINNERRKLYEYLRLGHEYGEIVLGFNQAVLIIFPDKPPRLILAKHVTLEDMLCYTDTVMKRTLKSKVNNIGIVVAKGNFSLQKGRFSMAAVNQIVIGDDESACFPGNASLVLRGGERVRMDELKIGDHVLSINPATGKPVYSRVYLWAHRDPHITATFLHITHPHGHLHISANHLILSGEQRRPVPADQLQVGDTIYFIPFCQQQQQQQQQQQLDDKEKRETLISIPVLHIKTCTQKGYYTPFTNNGFIVVDGVTASVYSQVSTHPQSYRGNSCYNFTNRIIEQFGMHKVGHTVLTPMRMGYYTLGIGKVLSQMDTETHLNKYCELLLDSFYLGIK